MKKAQQLIQNTLDSDTLKITPLSKHGVTHCYIVQSNDTQYFAKVAQDHPQSLSKEATGLKQLRKVYPFVPEVIAFSEYVLVTEYIKPEKPTSVFWKRLGLELAFMHQRPQSSFGFFENNYIGASTQENVCHSEESSNWSHFFWKHRIQFKLDQLQHSCGFRLEDQVYKKLKITILNLLSKVENKPTLVHGDLWNGNIVCGPKQKPYLIDPAIYYGHCEVDIAMTECFGGFSPLFYENYQQIIPLSVEYQQRKHIYNLYHLLNHFIIFGNNYQSGVEHLVKLIIDN